MESQKEGLEIISKGMLQLQQSLRTIYKDLRAAELRVEIADMRVDIEKLRAVGEAAAATSSSSGPLNDTGPDGGSRHSPLREAESAAKEAHDMLDALKQQQGKVWNEESQSLVLRWMEKSLIFLEMVVQKLAERVDKLEKEKTKQKPEVKEKLRPVS